MTEIYLDTKLKRYYYKSTYIMLIFTSIFYMAYILIAYIFANRKKKKKNVLNLHYQLCQYYITPIFLILTILIIFLANKYGIV